MSERPDTRPLWMRRLHWICAYLSSAGINQLVRDPEPWPRRDAHE